MNWIVSDYYLLLRELYLINSTETFIDMHKRKEYSILKSMEDKVLAKVREIIKR